eukprot:CAMPEP_0197874634 /NCGR_PEP_ID=MMETSP1439-20131203/4105_1 /TAXON_ID=66791 /ORGANISM="Gonyaulax spinifera, Strain CCMP409" /LENGTH=50 /DNA_ID=CAMNT_0043493781 /DNA_START=65 /DNA_END=213 /DNA_ORIENTATION=+
MAPRRSSAVALPAILAVAAAVALLCSTRSFVPAPTVVAEQQVQQRFLQSA